MMKKLLIKENFGYCFSCEKLQKFKIITQEERLKVKDEYVNANQYKCVCNKCKNNVINEEIEQKNDFVLYEMYKKQKGLMLSSEIKSLREKYSISQVNLAKLLNFGEKSIARYESGSIQDETHDLMLKLIKNDVIFKSIWEINKSKLDQKSIAKVESKIYSINERFQYKNDIKIQTFIDDFKYSGIQNKGVSYV